MTAQQGHAEFDEVLIENIFTVDLQLFKILSFK
jgi:hypothetical protein